MDAAESLKADATTDRDAQEEGGSVQHENFPEKSPRDGEGEAELKQTHSVETFPPLIIAIPSILSLYLAMFLVALDRTIVATATPRITDTFHSIDDIGWYGSAYLMTGAAFQLIWGRIYTFWPQKACFLTALAIFEAGSLLCGAAPSSKAFIVGRALAGAGNAGIFSGALSIFIHLVPLQKRPLFAGLGGAIFGIASVAGPLLGGVFTDKVSWRWCFYINLPIGGLASLVIILLIRVPTKVQETNFSFKEKLRRLDPLGSMCFLPGIICLVLALQWGGSKYAWGNARIIVLLILSGLLLSAFVAVQFLMPETATLPPRILKQRSMAAGFFFVTFMASTMLVFTYYLPIWFQAIKAASAVRSGIMVLPMLLALVVGAISSGATISLFVGYYTPYMIACGILISIASGLITTFTTETGHAKWIGYQVMLGFGLGLGMQQSNMAAQTVLPKVDVPSGTALVFFGQQLGGAIFIAVAQTVFTNRLASTLFNKLHLDPSTFVREGATEFRKVIHDNTVLGEVLTAYNDGLVDAFRVGLGVACVVIVPALFMEWKSVRKEKKHSQMVRGSEEKEQV